MLARNIPDQRRPEISVGTRGVIEAARMYVSLGGNHDEYIRFANGELTRAEILGMLPNDWARGRLCLKWAEKERHSWDWNMKRWTGQGRWVSQNAAKDIADTAAMYDRWAALYFQSWNARQQDQIIHLLKIVANQRAPS